MPTEKKNVKRKKRTLAVKKKKEDEQIESVEQVKARGRVADEEGSDRDETNSTMDKENDESKDEDRNGDGSGDEDGDENSNNGESKNGRRGIGNGNAAGGSKENTNNKKSINKNKSMDKKKSARKEQHMDESDAQPGAVKKQSVLSQTEIEQIVLSHMELSYRPHSIQDLLIAFKNEIKRATLASALDALVEKDRVISKLYNKSAVYVYNYGNTCENGGDVHEIEECMKGVEQEISSLKDGIARLKEYPSDEQLMHMIVELRERKEKVRAEMDEIRKAGIDKGEYDRVMGMYKKLVGMKKCRMGILRNIVDELCEGMGKKKGAIVEELGLSDEVLKK